MTGIIGAMVEAWDEIRIHRLRVILSLLTVGVAIAIMTGTVALGQQMAQATQEMTDKWSGRATTLTVMAWPSDWEKVDELADAIQDFTVNHEIEYASREAWGYGQFSTLAGTLDTAVLSAEEGVVFNAEISAAIEESLAATDYGAILADRGVTTVALDDDGNIVEYRPDGTVATPGERR